MVIRKIKTGGIGYLEPFPGSGGWYWGTDYTSGDLYEAEELWRDRHRIRQNRLIFADADGNVYEPVPPAEGCYFGRPAYDDGRIVILLADFPEGKVKLLAWDREKEELSGTAEIPLDEIEDCYNLMPQGDPLMVTRQAGDHFEIVWPERVRFSIGPSESFCFRDGERLYFSRWIEDPDYREEVVVRTLPDGAIAEVFDGSINCMPDGEMWILEQRKGEEG